MKNLEDKKISVILFIGVFLSIISSIILKEDVNYNNTTSTNLYTESKFINEDVSDTYAIVDSIDAVNAEYNARVAVESYPVTQFFLSGVPYRGLMNLLFILLGLSIYLFIYKTDSEIKVFFNAIKNKVFGFLHKIKNSFLSSLKLIDFKYLIKVIVVISIFISLLVWGIYYYNELQIETTKGIPHSISESLFVGFMGSLKIIIPLLILFRVVKALIPKKK